MCIRDRYGTESAAPYAAYYAEHMDYLVFDPGTNTFLADPDARALGVPNRQVAILDRALDWLQTGTPEERVLAQRALRRYTGQELTDPASWARMLSEVRDTLFFSDVGGFRFYSSDEQAAARASHVSSERPSREDWQRITSDVRISQTRLEPGEAVTLTVRLSLSPGWHVYAELPEGSPYRRCTVKLGELNGLNPLTAWTLPSVQRSAASDPGVGHWEGDAMFSIRLQAKPDAQGEFKIPVLISYQACDADSCLRPTSESLEVPVVVGR